MPDAAEKVLIVGAGAVGLVYARHLVRGGADVSFFVREKYLADVAAGFTLYPLNESVDPVRLDGLPGLATLDQVRARQWDQVWLCIPSTGLRGQWLGPFMEAIGDAVVVSFQPGLRDGELLGAHVPADRLAKGIISFSSWPAPLPGSERPEPGTAYWFPPLSPCLFQGPQAGDIAATLRAGGCPSKVGEAAAATTKGSAFLLPTMAAMECGGWTFAGLRQGRWAELAAQASREALAISCTHAGLSPGAQPLVTHGFLVKAATRLVPLVAPFDIETFFKVHFSKVGGQTELALDSWIATGQQLQLSTTHLQELQQALLRVRATAST